MTCLSVIDLTIALHFQGKGDMTTWWLLSREDATDKALPGNQTKPGNEKVIGNLLSFGLGNEQKRNAEDIMESDKTGRL